MASSAGRTPVAVKRLLYVGLDGLADDPVPELGDRTPLEAAETPFLEALARRGRTGTVVTAGEGIAPESDVGVFAIKGAPGQPTGKVDGLRLIDVGPTLLSLFGVDGGEDQKERSFL